jgi:hypothetical protein
MAKKYAIIEGALLPVLLKDWNDFKERFEMQFPPQVRMQDYNWNLMVTE